VGPFPDLVLARVRIFGGPDLSKDLVAEKVILAISKMLSKLVRTRNFYISHYKLSVGFSSEWHLNACQTGCRVFSTGGPAGDDDRGRTSFAVTHSNRSNVSNATSIEMGDPAESAGKKKVMDFSPPRGTRDFFPEDQRLKSWLFSAWHTTASSYAFEEYDAPILENEELYVRKAGEEVTQQLYNFTDKGGRRLSLRPEMTPSLARLVLLRKNTLSMPLKWYSVPQCWRYERMTRGRRREHYQWNMDIWGVPGVEAEAELLSAAVQSMKAIGITSKDVGIKINSRKILNALMAKHGIAERHWTACCILLDKLDKVHLDALRGKFLQLEIDSKAIDALVRDIQVGSLDVLATRLDDSQHHGVEDLRKLMQLAEAYGYADWLVFDPSIVRGLAYYTGVIFEGFDRKGELRAIFGGGRYDALSEAMGGTAGENIPAVGFGFGDAVIMELLQAKGLVPDMSTSGIQILLMVKEETTESRATAVRTATMLRAAGYKVDLVLEPKRAKWVFSKANKLGARAVVVVHGELLSVKNLQTQEQQDVSSDSDGDGDGRDLLQLVRAAVGSQ